MGTISSYPTEKTTYTEANILACMLSVAMETSGRIWPNFELIQAPIHVLITSKYEKDPVKNSGENVMTSFSPL